MEFDGPDGPSGPSIADLLQFARGLRSPVTPPADPIEQLQAALWEDARRPKGGGLIGSEYARYMADNGMPVQSSDGLAWLGLGVAPEALSGANQPPAFPQIAAGGPSPSGSSFANGAPSPFPPATGTYPAPPMPGLQVGSDPNLFGEGGQRLPEAGAGQSPLDRGLAGPTDGAAIFEIGNPHSPRLRREWERSEGRDWPRDPVTGQRYDVAHIRALADGGKNVLENIRPMSRLDHLAEHIANGDFARWAKRPGIARAFGGRVGAMLGPFGLGSDILGLLSGRIRADSIDNLSSDWMGVPSREDRLKAFENEQKAINPNWKWGDQIVLTL
jgi:hypothetical protein